MAQQVTTSFIDDIDGAEAEGTVAFALDGRQYAIDLSTANAAKLKDILAPYVASARRAGRDGQVVRRPRTPASNYEESQAIREWAQTQGLAISDRGRIAATVMEAYRNRDADPRAEVTTDDAPKMKKRSRKKAKSAD